MTGYPSVFSISKSCTSDVTLRNSSTPSLDSSIVNTASLIPVLCLKLPLLMTFSFDLALSHEESFQMIHI